MGIPAFRIDDNSEKLTPEMIFESMEAYKELFEAVKYGEDEYKGSLGWLDPSVWAGNEWLSTYKDYAKEVQEKADVLVVIGIGGSNQAARAVVDAIGEKGSVKIVWAGNSISAYEINSVLNSIKGKSVYINVIAKNFETLEPGIGFRALRSFLKNNYGDDYCERVICTGTLGSHLHDLSKSKGYRFLPFPDEIGGRFTALSPIGLFPMAVAGMDIDLIAKGAKDVREQILQGEWKDSTVLRFAVIRNLLYDMGYRMEMLSFFEPRLFRFAKWWMQLFGESEGKDSKGLYPVFGNFSEDLHSIGQFLQEGTPVIFETMLDVKNSGASVVLGADSEDRFDYLDGKDFDYINRKAFEATRQAHSDRYPVITLEIEDISEESFGSLFYFFEFACYLSARILGVNPFDQPGVEAYKINMFKALGKI